MGDRKAPTPVDTKQRRPEPPPAPPPKRYGAHESGRHSDGPWTIGENTSGEPAIVDGSGIMLVSVIKRWTTTNADEWKRNADLIAAAPELLSALKNGIGFYPVPSPMRNAALAAIAKAEGRT